MEDELRAVIAEELIEELTVGDAAQDSDAVLSECGKGGVDFEKGLLGDFEEHDLFCAGSGEGAHHGGANEAAGSGDEDARAGGTGDAEGAESCGRAAEQGRPVEAMLRRSKKIGRH
jgi:hypothetical protein